MKRRKVDSQRERRMLIAMIASTPFLQRVAGTFDPALVDTPHFRQVAEWCLEYYRDHKKAPGSHIEDLFNGWEEDNENAELVDSVRDFLGGLSDEFDRGEELNVPFLVDECTKFITKRKLARLREALENTSKEGMAEAEAAVLAYEKAMLDQAAVGINPTTDKKLWKEVFAAPANPIINFEGDAGLFFNSALTRDAVFTIQAPEKTGKTWWLIEFAFRGIRERRKVAFFQVGDQSKVQFHKRLGMRWADLPLWESQVGKVLIPEKVEFDEDEDSGYRIVCRSKKRDAVVGSHSVLRGIRRFRRANGWARGREYLKTSVHPMGSLNVRGIEDILDTWLNLEGFVPDVVIVDYADILAPEDSKRKYEHDRNVVNDTWKALRRLSQKRHVLVITATQANATSYTHEATLQTMKSFSEDKRKLAHITAMVALNQTPEEKEVLGMRLNWIVLREAPYSITRPLYVGTCFTLGRALCVAKLQERNNGS